MTETAQHNKHNKHNKHNEHNEHNEHNVAPKTLVDAFVAARAEQLKTLIAAGRTTQADADALLATARTHATEQIENSNTSNACRISSSWLTRPSTTIGGAYRTSVTSPALHKPQCRDYQQHNQRYSRDRRNPSRRRNLCYSRLSWPFQRY